MATAYENTNYQQQSTPAPNSYDYGHLGLALDTEDAELLQEAVQEAEGDPDALLNDMPNAQKLKTFSVICLIVNRMIGE